LDSETARRTDPTSDRQQALFEDDSPGPVPRWVEVNTAGVRVENCRQFGGPWLALQLIQRLQLDEFLKQAMPPGVEHVAWSVSALILVIARLLEPSSELYTAEQWYPKTALAELLGVPVERVDDNRLYRTLDEVLPLKEKLQVHLKGRLGNLFALEYDLLLYDLVGTPKSLLKKYEQELLADDWHKIREGIEVKLLPVPPDEDDEIAGDAPSPDATPQKEIFILCRSRDRVKKDEGILRRFEQKIEERLRAMAVRCEKQTRDTQKVEREVGRMLGQNTRAARLFKVTVEKREDGGARLAWKKIEDVRDWTTLSAGCYLLRTNVLDWTDEELWKTYMQLTEAEAAFRIHKTDLSIRPIWHQKEDRVLAHILVCFLAYVLWKTLAQLCRQAGLGDEPRRVLDELAEIRLVDVVLPTRGGTEIRQRCVSRPTEHHQILLDQLQLRLPFRMQPGGPTQ
jgi:hypothetical protein